MKTRILPFPVMCWGHKHQPHPAGRWAGLMLGGLLLLTACAEDSDGTQPSAPDRASAAQGGGGIFGAWTEDAYGFPAFDYTLDERTDPRAVWTDSAGESRTDHFQVFGNARLNAMALDYGPVQLYTNDRAPTWLNRISEESLQLGGGFSYVQVDGETWSSAHRWAPPDATFERRFGVGYVENVTRHGGLELRHRVLAPAGNDPVLIDEVTLTWEGTAPTTVRHYEYWDVNRHQLESQWVRGLARTLQDERRDRLNQKFLQQVSGDGSELRASMRPAPGETPPPADRVSALDWYPPTVFLRSLSDPADEVHTDQSWFFGRGSASEPETVQLGLPGGLLPETNADGQPAMLAMRHNLVLEPHQPVTLRFAYGWIPFHGNADFLNDYTDLEEDLLASSLSAWQPKQVAISHPTLSPEVAREAQWRSLQLQGSTVWLDYYQTALTPQGSAYLYLHGADGAPRDQALFAMSTVWMDPALARGNLQLIMGVTDAESGAITYSFTDHGVLEHAFIHQHPSDLDIFFLTAMTEYLAATGDLAFLGTEVPFHPRGSTTLPPGATGRTALDHVRAAVTHLRDQVGTGEHGHIRIGDGDWSDGIIWRNPQPRALLHTMQQGESIPNSQQALFTLPRLAAFLEGVDPALAAECRALGTALETPVRDAFGDRWFARAWFYDAGGLPFLEGQDGSEARGPVYLDLEAQPWGLLSGVLSTTEREALLDEIERRLDDDSPIGPRLTEGGQVWPAISGLMTWAYARYRPEAAWRSIEEHLYATHADQFPEQWMGVLSGPDGFESTGGSNPGGTWSSAYTPMADFPVSNMNPDAMWLLSLVRLAGLEPGVGVLRLAPAAGPRPWTLDTPLIRVTVEERRILGQFRPERTGKIPLEVAIPTGSVPTVTVAGGPVATSSGADSVRFTVSATAGKAVDFEVRW